LRIIAYIDGFNLYYGLRDSGYKRYYWLNVQSLSASLLKEDQNLVKTKYFTAPITGSNKSMPKRIAQKLDSKRKRQITFLEAVETLENTFLYYGHYLLKKIVCKKCNSNIPIPEEKMTDASIATEIVADAYEDNYDMALIISADSDLCPPILKVKERFPSKRIKACFPPKRFSSSLKGVVDEQITIGRGKLKANQLPDRITKPDGYILERPREWS